MHEMGLAEAIVDAAVRRAAGRRVTRIRVRIGGHPVDEEIVTMGIAVAAAGTEAEGAAVDLIEEPMSIRCAECGHAAVPDDQLATVACPHCGCLDIEITGTDTVVLEAITVALPEHA